MNGYATPLYAVVIALLSLIPAYLTYRSGNRAQKSTEHAGVYAGYGGLLEHLQEEMKRKDEELQRKDIEIADLKRRLEAAEGRGDVLQRRLEGGDSA